MSNASVYLCSPTNSTFFTTCCSAAIGTERKCPKCKASVYPFYDNMTDDEADCVARGNIDRSRWFMAYKK